MKLDVDLDLLGSRFADLSTTPYFRKNIREYAKYLSEATKHVVSDVDGQPEEVRRSYSRFLWLLYKYIAGSTVSESPYEMEYCLASALKDWIFRDCAIATTLSMDLDFHFLPVNAQQTIKMVAPSFSSQHFDVILAPMALPRLYKHRPLYCTPLYHELGHFIDRLYGVADLSLMNVPGHTIHQDPSVNLRINRSHRAEYFCDLFAAQYIGNVAAKSLDEIAPNAIASISHPATKDRTRLIEVFLSGGSDPVIDAFQQALQIRGADSLKVRFEMVDVAEALDDIRPIKVTSSKELHGLFPSVWGYLEDVRGRKRPAWNARDLDYPAIDRAVNDLLEKSIRNQSCVEMWQHATSN